MKKMKKEYALEAFDRDGRFLQQIDVFPTLREALAEMANEQKNGTDGEETLGITEIVYGDDGEECSHERVM